MPSSRAAETEHLCLGGRFERLGSGAEQPDDAKGGLAAEAFLAQLVEQSFLDGVRLFGGVGAYEIELGAQHLGFRARAQIGSCTHRERAGRGRGQRGERDLRML